VENFMLYKDFQYERHEWDNIPIIVPRYIIYLSKYVKGISGYCKYQSELEPTATIRHDLDHRYSELLSLIDEKRQLDREEKAGLEKNLKDNRSSIE
jgi:hypothetical protein